MKPQAMVLLPEPTMAQKAYANPSSATITSATGRRGANRSRSTIMRYSSAVAANAYGTSVVSVASRITFVNWSTRLSL